MVWRSIFRAVSLLRAYGQTDCVCPFVEAFSQPEQHVADPAPNAQEADLNGEEVYNPPNNTEGPVVEETPIPEVIDEVPNNVAVAMPTPSAPAPAPVPQEEAPKKSYASIVSF